MNGQTPTMMACFAYYNRAAKGQSPSLEAYIWIHQKFLRFKKPFPSMVKRFVLPQLR